MQNFPIDDANRVNQNVHMFPSFHPSISVRNHSFYNQCLHRISSTLMPSLARVELQIIACVLSCFKVNSPLSLQEKWLGRGLRFFNVAGHIWLQQN